MNITMNGKYDKNIKKWKKNEQKDETQRDKEQTIATLPIHDNVILVREGEKNDGEEHFSRVPL